MGTTRRQSTTPSGCKSSVSPSTASSETTVRARKQYQSIHHLGPCLQLPTDSRFRDRLLAGLLQLTLGFVVLLVTSTICRAVLWLISMFTS